MRATLDGLLDAARGDVTLRRGGTLHLEDVREVATFEAAWRSPNVLAAVRCVLGPAASVERVHYRGPQPGFGAQALHADWPEPIAVGRERSATAIVALVAFTVDGGATRVVPGSHRLPRLAVPADPSVAFPGERIVTCAAGDAIVFGAHLRHGGTRNRSSVRRDSLQITFAR